MKLKSHQLAAALNPKVKKSKRDQPKELKKFGKKQAKNGLK